MKISVRKAFNNESVPEVLLRPLGDPDKLGGGHTGHRTLDHEEGLQGDVCLALAEPLAQEQRTLVLQLEVKEGGLPDQAWRCQFES